MENKKIEKINNSIEFSSIKEEKNISLKNKHRRVVSTPIVELNQIINSFKHYKIDENDITDNNVLNNNIEQFKPETPILQGYLNVKSKKNWKKKWVILDTNNLYLFKRQNEMKNPEIVSLFCSSIRLEEDKKLSFILLTVDNKFFFNADSEREALIWTVAIEDVCNNLIQKIIGSDKKKLKRNSSRKESFSFSPEKKELLDLMKKEGNNFCADCNSPEPEWVSINLGIFICIECSGAHRNLGTHISKVRSFYYDIIEPQQIEILKSVGNIKSNQYWESGISLQSIKKPSPEDSLEIKQQWIRKKYAEKAFIDKNQPEPLYLKNYLLENEENYIQNQQNNNQINNNNKNNNQINNNNNNNKNNNNNNNNNKINNYQINNKNKSDNVLINSKTRKKHHTFTSKFTSNLKKTFSQEECIVVQNPLFGQESLLPLEHQQFQKVMLELVEKKKKKIKNNDNIRRSKSNLMDYKQNS